MADEIVAPAWQAVTDGESTMPVLVAVAAAGVLQSNLPNEIAPQHPGLFPAVALALMMFITVAYGARFERRAAILRLVLLGLITTLSVLNIAVGVRLVHDLLEATGIKEADRLLWAGGSVWATNVILFALWYWMFDRGGPIRRSQGTGGYPDLLFPQMTVPELTSPQWAPNFWDYLYTSFTTSTAFSPTDTMPMARWTKLTMLVQSSVALVLAVLVVARAVNVL